MRKLILIVVLFSVSPTFAQQQGAFVPYTIDQDTHNKIMAYLGEQPAKVAIPLIQTFNALSQKAAADSVKPPKPDEQSKPEEKK